MLPPGIRPDETPPFYKLDEYAFQRLCRDLVSEQPEIATCDVYGVRGQKQHGIDLRARRQNGDGVDVGQCKCYESITAPQIAEASEEFFQNWDRWSAENVKRFVLFVACDLDNKHQQDEIGVQEQRFAARGIVYEAWSAATITTKLRPHRHIVRRYVSDYWVRHICGEAGLASPFIGGEGATGGVTVTLLAGYVDDLASHASSEMERRLDEVKAAWREGRRSVATSWIADLKGNRAVWEVLQPRLKGKILKFEAGITIDVGGDANIAKQLADEAKVFWPDDNQAALRAMIAYRESGPEAALVVLASETDIESINLRAGLLLEMGRTAEGLDLLSSMEGNGAN